MVKHVFLTHAAEDKAIAVLVCEALEKAGIQCWYAPRNVPLGMNFEEAIIDAISTSGLMILILSAHSNNSPHVKREIQNACIENVQVPILPFRVEDIPLNKALRYYLGSTQWLDASTPPLEAHLGTLVKHVEASLSQAPPAESEEQARQRVEQEAAAWKLAEDKEAQRIAELHAAGLAESARLRAAKEAAALKLADTQRLAEQREAVRLAESARLRAEKESADLKLDWKKEAHRLAEQREVVRQVEAALAAAQVEQEPVEEKRAPLPPVAETDAYRSNNEAAENVAQKAALVHTNERSRDVTPSFELQQFEKRANRTLWYVGGAAALLLVGIIVVISYLATNNETTGAVSALPTEASGSPATQQNTGDGDRNDGSGVPGGPGSGDYNRIFRSTEVSSKARVLSKPEAQYTEQARKNQITGTVVLRALFTSDGRVTSIRPLSSLPYGLTEQAIVAARQIRFTPATKDGRPVSMYIVLEYNFNLY